MNDEQSNPSMAFKLFYIIIQLNPISISYTKKNSFVLNALIIFSLSKFRTMFVIYFSCCSSFFWKSSKWYFLDWFVCFLKKSIKLEIILKIYIIFPRFLVKIKINRCKQRFQAFFSFFFDCFAFVGNKMVFWKRV